MRQLEADHLAEEADLATTNSANGSATSPNLNGNTTSAPTTPPGRANGAAGQDKPAPIGQGRELANGAKSMPASRRTSGYGGSFGLEKLSLSVMDSKGKTWTDEEDVDAEGAQSESFIHRQNGRRLIADSVKYLGMNDDDPFPGIPKADNKVGRAVASDAEIGTDVQRISTASAALDLAPLSQTPPRAFGARPFDTAMKTSEWPQFGSQITSPLAQHDDSVLGASRKTSPTGMADSIASLPAVPSKSVPGTPFGLAASGGMTQGRRSGTSPNIADGLSQSQRGFSNPDLARNYGKQQGAYAMEQPRVSLAMRVNLRTNLTPAIRRRPVVPDVQPEHRRPYAAQRTSGPLQPPRPAVRPVRIRR